jgi:hypothetical protein
MAATVHDKCSVVLSWELGLLSQMAQQQRASKGTAAQCGGSNGPDRHLLKLMVIGILIDAPRFADGFRMRSAGVPANA